MDHAAISALISNGPWPPKTGEHLVFLYQGTNFKIGEFVNSLEENQLEVKIYQPYTLDVPNNLSLWQDCDDNNYIVSRQMVLPVRPQIEVVPSLSRMTRSGRRMVFPVENNAVIESLVHSSE